MRWFHAVFALILITAVFLLFQINPADRVRLMEWGEQLADRPWTPVILIITQTTLYAFALSGGIILWVTAPFYEPWQATLILTTGNVIGAFIAYKIASHLGTGIRIRLSGHRAFRILSERSDFMTQSALRLLPGFPHAIINYGGGVLHLPLKTFMIATLVGASLKWAVYSMAIHGIVEADDLDEVLQPATLLPLILLTAFLVAGSWAARHIRAKRNAADFQ